MTMLRYVWALPATVLGLIFAATALWRGQVRVIDGVVEAHGPVVRSVLSRLPSAPSEVAAITFGHVVLGIDADAIDDTRAHERVHVRQYERWGPAFIPAYLIVSLWAFARGRHIYFDNYFEREAFDADR